MTRRRGTAARPAVAVDERGLLPPSATLYGRLLRLRQVRLRWWLRALYFEGALVGGFVLYLANWASAWVLVALPGAIGIAVKIYDVALATDVFGSAAPVRGDHAPSRAVRTGGTGDAPRPTRLEDPAAGEDPPMDEPPAVVRRPSPAPPVVRRPSPASAVVRGRATESAPTARRPAVTRHGPPGQSLARERG